MFRDSIDKYVALYIRVSTDEQAEHGFSIDFQKERLEAYCISQGWPSYRLYIDDGYTGTNLTRPAMQRLMKHVKEGKVSMVVVYKLDRLSRRQKDVLHVLEDVLEPANTHFRSATEPFDTSTPFGKAMVGILSVFAQLERDTIIERTTAGRRKRIKEGIWSGGRIPFGYNWVKEQKTLLLNHEQASLLREAASRFLRKDSTLSIAEYMATKTSDRVFDHNIVIDMLTRPINVGLLSQHDGSMVQTNIKETVFDMATYNLILAENARRKASSTRHAVDKPHLLSGILHCSLCGSAMYRYRITQKKYGKEYEYVYYACKEQHVRKKDRKGAKCSQGYKDVKKLDDLVASTLKHYSLSPDLFEQEMAALQEPSEDNVALKKELVQKMKTIESKLDRWYTAFEEGSLDPQLLKKRIDTLESEKRTVEERLDELEDISEITISAEERFDSVTAIAEAWDDMTLKEQQSALRLLVDKVTVSPDWTISITWAT